MLGEIGGDDEAVTLADEIAILAAHPGRLVRLIKNDLKRPRSRTGAPEPMLNPTATIGSHICPCRRESKIASESDISASALEQHRTQPRAS